MRIVQDSNGLWYYVPLLDGSVTKINDYSKTIDIRQTGPIVSKEDLLHPRLNQVPEYLVPSSIIGNKPGLSDFEVKEILVAGGCIEPRFQALSDQISDNLTESGIESIIIGSILKGSIYLLAMVSRMLNSNIKQRMDFIGVTSYIGEESSGELRTYLDFRLPLRNQDILLMEDIYHTGRTAYIVEVIMTNARRPKSIRKFTGFDKPDQRDEEFNNIAGDFVGFVLPPKYVIGFGLDLNELYRNIGWIGVVGPRT